jgi:hypothetical protein
MKKILLLVTAYLLISVPYSLVAATFDGSRPVLCASVDIHECVPGEACVRRTAADIDATDFYRVDFKNNTITATKQGDDKRTSKIERSETVDGKLVLQGVEDGREDEQDGLGWSLSIAEPSGRMVLTASGETEAFVIFGVCTPD